MEKEIKDQQKEISKLVRSVGEWSVLAVERKQGLDKALEEVERLKEEKEEIDRLATFMLKEKDKQVDQLKKQVEEIKVKDIELIISIATSSDYLDDRGMEVIERLENIIKNNRL